MVYLNYPHAPNIITTSFTPSSPPPSPSCACDFTMKNTLHELEPNPINPLMSSCLNKKLWYRTFLPFPTFFFRSTKHLTSKMRNHSKNHMGVSENRGTPKSSILIGFSITSHPFWGIGIPIFGNIHMGRTEFPSGRIQLFRAQLEFGIRIRLHGWGG